MTEKGVEESKDQFVLGVDLDGVCADFYGALRPIVAEWLGKELAELPEDGFAYGVREWGILDLDHYKRIHRFAVTQRKLFSEMAPIKGAGATLRRLSDKGVHIRVITYRLFISHFHQEAVRQTVGWLDKHGIPFWDLCFMKDKVEVGADMYVEDSPDNILALQEKARNGGSPVIAFTNSTNRFIDADLRAADWGEVEKLVEDEIERRGLKLPPPTREQGPASDA